jgi:F0F1-type ATP synthase gamma subunit
LLILVHTVTNCHAKLMAEGAQKHQIIYNRFQSVISFKPTVATVYSSEEYEKTIV